MPCLVRKNRRHVANLPHTANKTKCHAESWTEAVSDREGAAAQADADIDLYSGVGGSAGLSGVAEGASLLHALVTASHDCKLRIVSSLANDRMNIKLSAHELLSASDKEPTSVGVLPLAIIQRLQLALLNVKQTALELPQLLSRSLMPMNVFLGSNWCLAAFLCYVWQLASLKASQRGCPVMPNHNLA